MKMIPTYTLTPDEYFTVRRIKHLLGYELPEGAEREAEVAAAGCLFRKNDPFRIAHYEAAHDALKALHRRLSLSAVSDEWEGASAFMKEERRAQSDMVWEALEMLPHPGTLIAEPLVDVGI